jgi:hypothetical protein
MRYPNTNECSRHPSCLLYAMRIDSGRFDVVTDYAACPNTGCVRGVRLVMKHDYDSACNCYRCKGIRNNPATKKAKSPRKRKASSQYASKEEQNARLLDSGWANWDDRD